MNPGVGSPPRFGLVLPIQARGAEIGELIDELAEEVATAERAGFDAFFLPEFHQAAGGAVVSPLLVAAWLAAATEKIRLGTLVLAGPLHDPVRLAEDALMLDWATRGRLVLGVGAGHLDPDFKLFDRPHAERASVLEEILDVLDACWTGEPFSYSGRWFERRGQITPAPYTQPHPELWLGAHTAEGLRRAGSRADGWICDPQRDVDTVARLAPIYREAAEQAGRKPHVGLFREAWIADSRADAEREWGPHALAVHRLYYNVGAYRPEFEPWVGEIRDRRDFTFERIAPGRFLAGDGDDVREEATEWLQRTGASYLAVRMRFPGGPSHIQTLEAIERFGREVIAPLGY